MKASNQILANVHSIETFGAFDGPGIRYVLFLQGCPFQCAYCHNRDTWSMKSNRRMSVEDILKDYKKYKGFYKNGGITVSGGEPLLQTPFLIELFKEAKKENIHTCLDTSAACFDPRKNELFNALMSYTDLVLLDIKHIDAHKHEELTGSSNKHVLAFARYLDEISQKVVIRHVLIPDINNSENDLKKLRDFLDTLSNVYKIEVLPYHSKGATKWEQLGFDYPFKHIKEPNEYEVIHAESILKEGYSFLKK